MRPTAFLLIGVAAAAIAPAVATPARQAVPAEDATGEPLRVTIAALSSHRSRVAGYTGCDAAADYILDELARAGLQQVRGEEYHVTVPVDHGSSLRLADGSRVPLHALWPNLVRTPSLPVDGVHGPLIYAGEGDFGDFDGKDPDGAIALMRFNSEGRWLNAAMLGAEAVIFLEPEATTYLQAAQKFLQVPLRTPRFWVGREDGADLLELLAREPQDVRLEARVTWERRPTRNVVAVLPGADPVLAGEMVVLQTYYDGMSVVPGLAPAAEMAAGAAALLEIARYLALHPPARTVVFAFTSAHHLGLRGMSEFLQRHSRKESHFAALVEDPLDVKLVISLDLSTRTDELAIWNSSSSIYQRRFFAPFGRTFTELALEVAAESGETADTPLHNGITPIAGQTWENLMPGGDLQSSAQLALGAGIPALTFATAHDARLVVDTPLDVAGGVDIGNLSRQTRLLAGMLRRALDKPDLFPQFRMRLDDQLKGIHGRTLTFPRRSISPDRPRSGAVVALRPARALASGWGVAERSSKGVRRTFYTMSDEAGEFEVLGLSADGVTVEAYYLDPEDGEIIYAPNRGEQARIYLQDFSLDYWLTQSTSILFPCVATDFFELVDPRHLDRLADIDMYDETDATPQEYGYSVGTASDEPAGVLFSRPGDRVKVAMTAGLMGTRFLLLNAGGDPGTRGGRGSGYPAERPGSLTHTAYRAARDMWHLDEGRIAELRRFAIENRRLDELHRRAGSHLEMAERAMAENRWSAFMKHSRAAMGLEARAYPDVRATQNDVVRGVVYFMALLIPCAFFAERLLFAARDIRWQIGGFTAIFAAVWFCISLVHPAFELSNPFVVLLAFVILALAVFVLVLVLSRFNASMRQVGSAAVLIHDTDISRMGAAYSAFSLGISNMRRRKLRTALTFTTLLLLTFTVLSFTSVQTRLHFSRVEQGPEARYIGALIRSLWWRPLPESALDYARAEFGSSARVVPRSWFEPSRAGASVTVFGKDSSVRVRGMLGLAPEEGQVTDVQRCLVAGTWFEDRRERTCLLPLRAAELLGIDTARVGVAQVEFFGETFTVRGIFDPDELDAILDLDGEPLTPVEAAELGSTLPAATALRQRQQQESAPPSLEPVSLSHLSAREVLILPYQVLRETGGSLQSVAVRLDEPASAQQRLEAFLSRLAITLFAGLPDADGGPGKVWTYNSIGVTALGGVADQAVPVVIAALIVLNTMMGAVHERLREIGIYSSVGLAPVHISFLFIAEACVYAVLGVVAGYLTGQASARLLVSQGWAGGISLNYSSMAAVAAAMLVMAVVLLSSLYPARVAAQMAVPDVTRRWELPEPAGDTWEFAFPFTVARAEVSRLFAFLTTYLEAYGEESIGAFFTQNTNLSASEAGPRAAHRIDTDLWLAPFDLGVSQHLVLSATPAADGAGEVCEIHLQIRRQSGEPGSWRRTNQRFVNTLRKQFLIWRTLPAGTKEAYGHTYVQWLSRGGDSC